MKGERGWNSLLLRKIQVYNITDYALLVRSQGVSSQIVAITVFHLTSHSEFISLLFILT